jgi:flagellar hook-associated protein 3 FlgL
MLRGLDARTDKFLNDLAQINRRLERAQREAASGRRVHQVSDDPDQISNILQLRTELEQTEQVRANLGRVKAEVDAAEQALAAAVSTMEQIATFGTQATGPEMTADRRLIIAHQVDALLQRMVVLSGTAVEGRYVFSGDSDGQSPYVLDPAFINDGSLADPVGAYQGAAATRQVLHPSGSRFAVSRDGGQIFDNPDPDLNVFAVINEMRAALRANNSEALTDVLAKTKAVETHLNTQLAFYGTVQNQVGEAMDFGGKQELRIKTRLSELEEADLTEALVTLNQAKYQQEVALTTQARLPKTSLFDFLG